VVADIADHAHVVKKRHVPRPEVGRRLEAAMKASADCKTQTALAKKARVSQSTVGRLMKGLVNSQSDTLDLICRALDIPVAELLRKPPAGELGTDARGDALESVANADLVPLISWVQAGSFAQSIDIYLPGYAEHWVKKPPKPCGPRTIALRVEGISMEPDYQEGDIIYVDPGLAPINGNESCINGLSLATPRLLPYFGSANHVLARDNCNEFQARRRGPQGAHCRSEAAPA
jgi:SOS-response transcriptional repressor LexA